MHVVHEVKAHDTESWVNFREWFTAFVAGKEENILDKTFSLMRHGFNYSDMLTAKFRKFVQQRIHTCP